MNRHLPAIPHLSVGTTMFVCLLLAFGASAQEAAPPASAPPAADSPFPQTVPDETDDGTGGTGGEEEPVPGSDDPAPPGTGTPGVPGTEAPGETDDQAPVMNDAAPPEDDATGGEAPADDGFGFPEGEEDPFAGSEDLDEALEGETVINPTATKGVVRGTVISTADGEPVIEARIQIEGTKTQTLTNLDGQYALELDPGTYRLRYWYPLHQAKVVPDVKVTVGDTTIIDVALDPEGSAIQVVEVVEQADRARAAVQIEKRKRAAVVSDAISGEEIARTPDSSAADATKRVVGATIVGGKYLVIRGLGGRYSLALMRGVPLPTPEPDEPVIPLDIFPASLLSSVVIAKTATPDLPGNFAGGALIIDPKQYPDRFTLQLKADVKGDTWSTFSQAPGPPDSGMDLLGQGPPGRAFPDLPNSFLDRLTYPRNTPEADVRNGYGDRFTNKFGSEEQGVPLGVGFGGAVGDTVSLFGRRLGYILNLNWSNRYDAEKDTVVVPSYNNGEPSDEGARADYVQRLGRETVAYGALGSVSYRVAEGQDLSLTSFYTSSNDDIAAVQSGFRNERNATIRATRLQLLQRWLLFNQLAGSHVIEPLNRATLDWQANIGQARRDEPDTRDTLYFLDTTTNQFLNSSGQDAATHLNFALDEQIRGAGVDFMVPFRTPWDTRLGEMKPKVGVLYSHTKRTFRARAFEFTRSGKRNAELPEEFRQLDLRGPNDLIPPGSVGQFWELEETTQAKNSYDGLTETLAGYALIDTPVVENLRLIAGVRYETYLQEVRAGIFDSRVRDGDVSRKEDNVLPSVNVVYALTPRTNLRAAYAQTVVRPQLREVACGLAYYDFVNNRIISGNCDLTSSLIHNADLRIEFFPGATEVLAASVFAKEFEDAIETVIFNPEGGDISFVNASQARLFGLELEARIGLDRISESLKEFGLTTNLTLVDSRVTLTREEALAITNRRHPLQGQSPYVVNLGLLYQNTDSATELSVLYNVFGRRLHELGAFPVPDIYELPFHTFDLTASQGLPAGFALKLAVTNVFDQERRLAMRGRSGKDFETSRVSPGVGASATLSWSM